LEGDYRIKEGKEPSIKGGQYEEKEGMKKQREGDRQ